jgi:ABC-type polysaccharide/polyol phosphate transport system ATPase subunit
LEDVDLEVKEGEFFGIVGRNGSGKSTLLKCLAGIYSIDSGSIQVNGRLSPFIELGVGFNPDLTARDNVVINATLLGLSRRAARERFDEIIAFAELEEFVDLKLKNYSSGMSVRLGFSVAILVDADVLLIDEVLAVGDASFQSKCFAEFDRMRDEGRTILFVTHDMSAVERFCDRAMLLERGRVMEVGEPEHIAQLYGEVNFGQLARAAPGTDDALDTEARISRVWCEDASGDRIVTSKQGDVCRACMDVEIVRDIQHPMFQIMFRNEARHTVFVPTSNAEELPLRLSAGERLALRFGFENRLAPGRYTLTPAVWAWDPGQRLVTERDDVASLVVEAERVTGGVADLPTNLHVERL